MAIDFLITNDDGIGSDGIRRLAEAASSYGNVWVVAPAHQSSAASHSITLRNAIKVCPYDFPVAGVKAFSCSGTPADCVRVGSLNVMPSRPDIVLSGVNYGYNVASDIQYSATAGAAFEAEFLGYLAIAFSEAMSERHEVADRYLSEILEELIKEPYVPGRIINVNFPDCGADECKGILRNRKVSNAAYYKDHYNVVGHLPGGGIELMVEGVHEPVSEDDTDYGAVLSGHISIGYVNNVG